MPTPEAANWSTINDLAAAGDAHRTSGGRAACPAHTGERGSHAHQVDVLAAIVATGSEKAAADRLFLSVNTVHTTMSNLKNRLDVRTAAQAVYFLTSDGRLTVPDIPR